MTETRRAAGGLIAVAALLLTGSTASAARYGSVEVVVESEPKGSATHGYAEIWVRVQNHSDAAAHTVRLTYPKASYHPGGDYLRAVTRTVSVEAGKAVRVSLMFPERVPLTGNGLGVAVDGSEQDEAISVAFSSRGYRSSYSSGYGSSYGSPAQPLILYSRAVNTNFPDWVRTAYFAGAGVLMVPGGSTTGSGPECVRAGEPVGTWSLNWLSYSRYDGVVVTADDLRSMPAEVRTAVAQYAECGGSLLVLGADAPLPGKWKPLEPEGRLTPHAAGFGDCFTLGRTTLLKWPAEEWHPVLRSWHRSRDAGQRENTPVEAHRKFPVVEDVGVPVKGLLVLMILFALVIGPLNLFFLARRKRKLWQFWTVPLVSVVTCLGVFAYMAITEGWQGRARMEGFTVLDETTRRATTIGWSAYYTPLLSGGGFHFSPATEVAYQNGEERTGGYYRRRSGGSSLTIDWTRDQHLASGWVTPRVPSHFAVRKGETRRERVTIGRGADGKPEAVNGLGADLTELWYCDEKGTLHRAANVPAGGRATLEPAARPAGSGVNTSLRDMCGADWSTVVDRAKADGPALLTPRTYLAFMDAAPFLDDALPGASVRKAKSAVLGILREGGDEG